MTAVLFFASPVEALLCDLFILAGCLLFISWATLAEKINKRRRTRKRRL